MNEIILSTQKLCKTFSSQGNQQHILKNLDLNIYRGDFTVIMGPSGAGKSTLLYALSGMDKPTLGTIQFSNKIISDLSNDQLAIFRRQHCGFVFQQIYLLDTMSVMDNVMAAGLLLSHNRKDILNRAIQLFKSVGLPKSCWSQFSSQLSGGEAQRAGIVRALINQPEIIIADEPTGQLNSASSTDVLNTLTKVNQLGQSIIMVTHDLQSARRGNRILYLQDGVIRGECHLGPYQPNNQKRHELLTSFLIEMGW